MIHERGLFVNRGILGYLLGNRKEFGIKGGKGRGQLVAPAWAIS
jgi:hypothetical protein